MAEPDYRAIATEVVELGENLFELALKGHAIPASTDDTTPADEQQPASEQASAYPVAEIRIAADEFFAALRLLLGLPQNNM